MDYIVVDIGNEQEVDRAGSLEELLEKAQTYQMSRILFSDVYKREDVDDEWEFVDSLHRLVSKSPNLDKE